MNSIQNYMTSYSRNLPTEIIESTVKSAIYSGALAALVAVNIEVGLITGGLAATITLISGLTMPIFKKTFADQRGNIEWWQHAASRFVNIAIAQCLISSLTTYRVNLIASAAVWILLEQCFNGFNDVSVRVNSAFVFI